MPVESLFDHLLAPVLEVDQQVGAYLVAARLFQSFSLSREAQQLIIDVGGLRSMHSQTVEKAGRKPLKDIKTMKDDAAAVEKESEAIKARYTKIFRV